jgi:hypothetical protein
MADVESGTHKISRGLSVLEVEGACGDVDIALAEALACLDFLAQLATGDSGRAVVDAQVALLRIAAAVGELKISCERAAGAYPSSRSAWPRAG